MDIHLISYTLYILHRPVQSYTCILLLYYVALYLQESSYRYWPEEVGEVMVCGRLRVRLGLVNGYGDIEERKIEVTATDDKNSSTNRLMVTMLHLISWHQQGLPHPASITSLYDRLTKAQMRSSSQLTVVVCRLDACLRRCL